MAKDIGKETVAESTIYKWFKENFPDTAISPHPTDYCAECASLQKKKQQLNVSWSRYRIQDVQSVDKMKLVQQKIQHIKSILEVHTVEVCWFH